jgi:hypothetical protein
VFLFGNFDIFINGILINWSLYGKVECLSEYGRFIKEGIDRE